MRYEPKLRFEAPAGTRVNRMFCGITHFDSKDLWWSFKDKKWMPLVDIKGPATTHAPCHSWKAFKRHIRKHREELKGVEMILCSRYRDHSVYCLVE